MGLWTVLNPIWFWQTGRMVNETKEIKKALDDNIWVQVSELQNINRDLLWFWVGKPLNFDAAFFLKISTWEQVVAFVHFWPKKIERHQILTNLTWTCFNLHNKLMASEDEFKFEEKGRWSDPSFPSGRYWDSDWRVSQCWGGRWRPCAAGIYTRSIEITAILQWTAPSTWCKDENQCEWRGLEGSLSFSSQQRAKQPGDGTYWRPCSRFAFQWVSSAKCK